jgi:ferredoxin-type protein NapG
LAKFDPPSSDSSVNRRSFFRQILGRGVEHIEDAGRALAEKFNEVIPHDSPSGITAPAAHADRNRDIPLQLRYLRPPGAVDERFMVDLCGRCGDCTRACPAQCIELDLEGKTALGLPYIVARRSPCVICTDLSCMKACSTGALNLVENIPQIDMGTAVLNEKTCLRGPVGNEEDCRLCISHCPLGETAITLDPRRQTVQVLEGCVGCGVCEQVCPTEPASIWVEPRTT